MPDLGGAYFKDNEKIRKYVDMLIVVIKIAEIKEAAKCIEPYVHNLSIPIIPVLIKILIPSLVNHEIRTIAFSSKTKHNSRASLFTTKIVKKNGYYTLSMSGVNLEELPQDLAKTLPKYPIVGVNSIGRLAVSNDDRGSGWGKLLIMDALHRSLDISQATAL